MTDVETRWTADEQRLNRLLHRAVDDAEPAAAAPTVTRPVEPVTDLGRRRRWTLVAVPLVAACVAAAVVAGIGLATRETRTSGSEHTAGAPPVRGHRRSGRHLGRRPPGSTGEDCRPPARVCTGFAADGSRSEDAVRGRRTGRRTATVSCSPT